ncbi:MAG: hypothetical protein WBA57_12945 [Elainellaceae cyanobacterium]
MKKQFLTRASLAFLVVGLLQACTAPTDSQSEAPAGAETSEDVAAESAESTGESGILEIRANGEDFVRQGFVSRDGWEISFDHLYVNVVEPTAYQTDPPFDPDAGEEIQAKSEAGLAKAVTVDLAEGDENAEPILIGEVSAPSGQYNALSWKMQPATEGPAAGSTLMLVGTAQKDGETVSFNLMLDPEYSYKCGEFVGDARKGILNADETTDVEATFHFDHIFGDGEAAADDPINTGALGFDPLATLAENGQLEADMAMLKEQLSPEDYSTLEETVAGLGHVGEGHCAEVGDHSHS